MTTAFIITRDRVTYARSCMMHLVAQNLNVVIVDHDSTHPDMLKWLDNIRAWNYYPSRDVTAGVAHLTLLRLKNAHPRDLWTNGTIENIVGPDERFIVTDCDVVPDVACPSDWLELLNEVLDHDETITKAGLGLRLDDIPEWYQHRDKVRAWEASWWDHPVRPLLRGVPLYRAPIDTTLALYRRFEPFKLAPAIRTGGFYQARHLPWHEDESHLTSDLLWYQKHSIPGVSHWMMPDEYK